MPEYSRRREPRRRDKPTEPAGSDAESGGEEQLYPPSRVIRQSRKSQRPNGSIFLEIQGDFKGDLIVSPTPGRRDNARSLPSPSPTPTRTACRRLRIEKPKASSRKYESPSESEDDDLSYTEDSASQDIPPRRSTKSMNPPEPPRLHSDSKKRHHYDEGYHTSGTAYTLEESKRPAKGKGKETAIYSVGEGSSSRPRTSSSTVSRDSRARNREPDPSIYPSDQDEEQREITEKEEDEEKDEVENEDEDASDDDFGKLPIQISNADARSSKAMSEKAVLDTGTKPDWISQTFYDDLKKTLEVKRSDLAKEDMKRKYEDFSGNEFQPAFKVDLMIQSEEFSGLMKCRRLSFLVAKKATFRILLGRDTIRNEELMTRRKRETDGEGAFAGIHGKLPDVEKEEMKRRKAEQDKKAQERKQKREEKTEDTIRRKENTQASSSKVAVHLATSVSRTSKTRSPPKTPKDLRKDSNSSLEGTW